MINTACRWWICAPGQCLWFVPGSYSQLAFTPDGNQFVGFDEDYNIFRAETATRAKLTSQTIATQERYALSSNGHWLAQKRWTAISPFGMWKVGR